MTGWLVARTQTNRERWAAENVARQGGEPYLPLIAARVRSGGLDVVRPQCLFPGFLFVAETDQWHFLMGTYGVRDLIMGGVRPAVVPEAEIAKIRALESREGFVELPVRGLRGGDGVRVVAGPFMGRHGVFLGAGAAERRQVLLEFLGSKRKVLIPDNYLMPTR